MQKTYQFTTPCKSSAVFRAPQHPQLRGAADLGRGRKGVVGKISIKIKTLQFPKKLTGTL